MLKNGRTYFTSLSLWVNNFSEKKNICLNPLGANPTKWSNTLKQFVGKSRRIKGLNDLKVDIGNI